MSLDSTRAKSEMQRLTSRVSKCIGILTGKPVTVAIFVGDHHGGGRFCHNFANEGAMQDFVTDILMRGGRKQ